MLIQISSGQGPTECSLAVEKLCKALQKEFKNTRIVSINNDYSGFGYKSATMEIKNKTTTEAWSKHTEIVRGNPVRVYEGENFKRKK